VEKAENARWSTSLSCRSLHKYGFKTSYDHPLEKGFIFAILLIIIYSKRDI
jgi:hypothetical protein